MIKYHKISQDDYVKKTSLLTENEDNFFWEPQLAFKRIPYLSSLTVHFTLINFVLLASNTQEGEGKNTNQRRAYVSRGMEGHTQPKLWGPKTKFRPEM